MTFKKLVSFDDGFLLRAHSRAFSPNGRMIVLPSKGNGASTFDCIAGGKLVDFRGHDARVVFAAFNSQGTQVVTVTVDEVVRVWDAVSGEQLLALTYWQGLSEENIRDIAWVEFSPSGRTLATGSRTRGIELWNLEQAGQRINIEDLPGTIGVFYANGDRVASHSRFDPKLSIRSAYDARWLENIQIANKMIRGIVFSPDDHFVALMDGTDMRTFLLWDLQNRRLDATLGGSGLVNDVTFNPSSELIASASSDKMVRLWHVPNGRDRATFQTSTDAAHPIVTASPNGANFAVATRRPTPISALCNFGRSTQEFILNARICVPASGDRFLAVRKGRLAIHAKADGKYLGFETYHHETPQLTTISRDGTNVAAYDDTDIVLWSPGTGARVTVDSGNSNVNMLRF